MVLRIPETQFSGTHSATTCNVLMGRLWREMKIPKFYCMHVIKDFGDRMYML